MRWIISGFAVLGSVIGLAVPLDAQSLAPATTPFNETAREAARISGQLVTGVQYSSAPDDGMLLEAYVPAEWAGRTICSRVVSVDGLYEATNSYSVDADWPGGPVQLLHPTEMPHMLKDRPADGVSVRVASSGCDARADEMALAGWSGMRDDASLLVNSFQADALFAYVESQTVPIRCEALPLKGRSAYDMRCPLADVQATGKVKVDLLRIVGGKPAPQSSLIVWLP